MSETKKRKFHTPEYKAKVALEALRSGKTINQIGQEFDVHPVQVGLWKKAIQEQAKTLFEGKRGPKPVDAQSVPDRLYSGIGRLKMELDWLKKSRDEPIMMSQDWIDMKDDLVATTRQCELAGVSRATMYVRQKPKAVDEDDLRLSRLIDEEYTRHPFYGPPTHGGRDQQGVGLSGQSQAPACV